MLGWSFHLLAALAVLGEENPLPAPWGALPWLVESKGGFDHRPDKSTRHLAKGQKKTSPSPSARGTAQLVRRLSAGSRPCLPPGSHSTELAFHAPSLQRNESGSGSHLLGSCRQGHRRCSSFCRISRTSRPKPHLPRGSFWRWHGSADDGGKGSPDLGGSFSMGSHLGFISLA